MVTVKQWLPQLCTTHFKYLRVVPYRVTSNQIKTELDI